MGVRVVLSVLTTEMQEILDDADDEEYHAECETCNGKHAKERQARFCDVEHRNDVLYRRGNPSTDRREYGKNAIEYSGHLISPFSLILYSPSSMLSNVP